MYISPINRISAIHISISRTVLALALIVATQVAMTATPAAAATTAFVNRSGDLVVNGTSASDEITVRAQGDQIIVESGAASFVFSNVYRDIVINSRGGNDVVAVRHVIVPRDLKVNVSSGSNDFTLSDNVVGRNFRLTDGGNSSSVYVEGSIIQGATLANLGAGHHEFSVFDVDWVGNQRITTAASGSIDLDLESARFNGALTLTTGNKADVVDVRGLTRFDGGIHKINLRGGADIFRWRSANLRSDLAPAELSVKMGSGNDYLDADVGDLNGDFTFDLGSGDDLGGMFNLDLANSGTVIGGPGFDAFGLWNLEGPGSVAVVSMEGGYGY